MATESSYLLLSRVRRRTCCWLRQGFWSPIPQVWQVFWISSLQLLRDSFSLQHLYKVPFSWHLQVSSSVPFISQVPSASFSPRCSELCRSSLASSFPAALFVFRGFWKFVLVYLLFISWADVLVRWPDRRYAVNLLVERIAYCLLFR